jgi:hypothetical protein
VFRHSLNYVTITAVLARQNAAKLAFEVWLLRGCPLAALAAEKEVFLWLELLQHTPA